MKNRSSDSVTDRSERDLTKRFDELNIDWEVVEDQLMAWSHLLFDGKNLRVDISVVYKEASPAVAVSTRQSTRRGGVTAVQLAERDELLEQQEASGLTTVHRASMRRTLLLAGSRQQEALQA